MDTKLKNMSRKWYMKGIAYLLLVACVITAATLLWMQKDMEVRYHVVGEESYTDTPEYYNTMYEYLNDMLLLQEYGSEEEIQKADFSQEVKDEMTYSYQCWAESHGRVRIDCEYDDEGNIQLNQDYSYDYWVDDEGYECGYDENGDYYEIRNEDLYSDDGSEQTVQKPKRSEELSYDAFIETYSDLAKKVEDNIRERKLKQYEKSLSKLDNPDIIVKTADESEKEAMIAEFKTYPVYGYLTTKGEIEGTLGTPIKDILSDYQQETKKDVYVGVSKAYYDEKQTQFLRDKEIVKQFVLEELFLVIAGILAFIYLIIMTGKAPEKEKAQLYALDKIWSEVIWIVGVLSGVGFVAMLLEIFENILCETWVFATYLGVLCLIGTLFLECILSQIRRLKTRSFFEGFICFRIMRKIFRMLRISWHKGKLSKRALVLAILLPILCATWVGAPFVIVFLIYMIYKYMGDFNEIVEGTKKIRDGELDYKIKVKDEEGMLHKLAENINTLSEGLDAAVSNELKSERLKSELISNVSHDLKTPLTSIVTYVDLLKQEEINNDAAKEYIDVIDRKSQRLTMLTADLFEAAKASSGDLPVQLENIDFNAIIRQALGEFDERIHQANMEIRTKLPEKAAIYADGKLTWRVVENLLSNVVKYGQSGSRVYMEVEEEKNGIVFTMKNISAYELNIPANELMERFTRGDASRNSEGSGLGLSIANSLVSLQHGSFKLDIDGDLFKVTVRLPKAE